MENEKTIKDDRNLNCIVFLSHIKSLKSSYHAVSIVAKCFILWLNHNWLKSRSHTSFILFRTACLFPHRNFALLENFSSRICLFFFLIYSCLGNVFLLKILSSFLLSCWVIPLPTISFLLYLFFLISCSPL